MQIGTVLITKKVLDLINSKVKFWQYKVPPSNIHTYVRNIYEYINKEPTRFTGETGVYAHSQRSIKGQLGSRMKQAPMPIRNEVFN